MSEDIPFLDTNVLLRHFVKDVPEQTERATAYLARVEAGELTVRTAETVIMETVFTLERTYRLSKVGVRERLLPFISMPGVRLPGKELLARVFDVYVALNLSFIDAYHVVTLPRWGLDTILTFDRGFDRVPGLRRIEP